MCLTRVREWRLVRTMYLLLLLLEEEEEEGEEGGGGRGESRLGTLPWKTLAHESPSENH